MSFYMVHLLVFARKITFKKSNSSRNHYVECLIEKYGINSPDQSRSAKYEIKRSKSILHQKTAISISLENIRIRIYVNIKEHYNDELLSKNK